MRDNGTFISLSTSLGRPQLDTLNYDQYMIYNYIYYRIIYSLDNKNLEERQMFSFLLVVNPWEDFVVDGLVLWVAGIRGLPMSTIKKALYCRDLSHSRVNHRVNSHSIRVLWVAVVVTNPNLLLPRSVCFNSTNYCNAKSSSNILLLGGMIN